MCSLIKMTNWYRRSMVTEQVHKLMNTSGLPTWKLIVIVSTASNIQGMKLAYFQNFDLSAPLSTTVQYWITHYVWIRNMGSRIPLVWPVQEWKFDWSCTKKIGYWKDCIIINGRPSTTKTTKGVPHCIVRHPIQIFLVCVQLHGPAMDIMDCIC